ncbi:unnamed protein product [Heterobilharzia americana]|nr:unnamed protein product [Heterobilharzia americana]
MVIRFHEASGVRKRSISIRFAFDSCCCICGTKSSSSRFTASQRYAEHFGACFGPQAATRSGDLCNACVLCVKRWLQRGKQPNFFIQVLDSKKGPGPKHMKEITKRARRREAKQQQQAAAITVGVKEQKGIKFTSVTPTTSTRSTCSNGNHCSNTSGSRSNFQHTLANTKSDSFPFKSNNCIHSQSAMSCQQLCGRVVTTSGLEVTRSSTQQSQSVSNGHRYNNTHNNNNSLSHYSRSVHHHHHPHNNNSNSNCCNSSKSHRNGGVEHRRCSCLRIDQEEHSTKISSSQGATRTRAAAARQLEAASAAAAAAAAAFAQNPTTLLSSSTPSHNNNNNNHNSIDNCLLVHSSDSSMQTHNITLSDSSEYESMNCGYDVYACCSALCMSSSSSSSSRCPAATHSNCLSSCCCCCCSNCCGYNGGGDSRGGCGSTSGCSGSTSGIGSNSSNLSISSPTNSNCSSIKHNTCSNRKQNNSPNSINDKPSGINNFSTDISCTIQQSSHHHYHCRRVNEFRHPQPPQTSQTVGCITYHNTNGREKNLSSSINGISNDYCDNINTTNNNNRISSVSLIQTSSIVNMNCSDLNVHTTTKSTTTTVSTSTTTIPTRRYNRRVVLPPVRMTHNPEVDSLLREIMERNSQAVNFDSREMHMAVQQELRLRSRTIHTAASASGGSVSGRASSISSADGSTEATIGSSSQTSIPNGVKCNHAIHHHHPHHHHHHHHHHTAKRRCSHHCCFSNG